MYKNTIIGLILIASVLLIVRFYVVGITDPIDDTSWKVTLHYEFKTKSNTASVNIGLPYETPHIKLVSHQFSYDGLGLKRQTGTSVDHGAQFYANEPGEYSLTQIYEIKTSQTPRFYTAKFNSILKQNIHSEYTQTFGESNIASYHKILSHLQTDTLNREQVVDTVYRYILNLRTSLPDEKVDASDEPEKLSINSRDKAIYMLDLLRMNDTPARLITGIVLQDDPVVDLEYWVEAYLNGQWRSYHPASGYRDALPTHYLALYKGNEEFVTTNDITESQLSLEIEKGAGSLLSRSLDQSEKSWLDFMNVNRLSAEVRQQLSLLLLLPLGALFTSFVRQILGIHSYGVFTPTMLALAIVYTDIVTTLLVLGVTVLAVYLGRPAFEKSISRTPRLSIIFTFVAVSMVMGISLLDVFGFEVSGHLVLLPIVIIASLIDRFFSTIEDHGTQIAMIRLFWTLLIAICILPILALDWLGYQLLSLPELHLYTAAILLLLASYKGNKLSDISVFTILNESRYTKDK